MATGPEHYTEAQRLIQSVKDEHGRLVIQTGAAEVIALAQVHATLATAQPAPAVGADDEEQADSDSDVFALIAEIATRLRDATDGGEYQAAGLIYDLANGITTVADARAELSGITFRHV